MPQKFIRSICVVMVMAFGSLQLSGCAAGSFGLTKDLGAWNRSFSPIPRVLIYILLFCGVYEITLTFDFLLNNTVEFWSGTPMVAQNRTFEKDGKKVVVENTRDPLRRTLISVYNKSGRLESINEMRETPAGTVQVYINGEKKTEMKLSLAATALGEFN